MQTFKAIIGSSALVMLTVASPAMADSPTQKLKGDFAFSGSATCVVSPATNVTPTSATPPLGFTNLKVNGQGNLLTFSIQGVRTFNGDGTGSVRGRVASVGDPGVASASDISANFTYSVAADGMFQLNQGPTESVAVAGPSVGHRSLVTGIPPFIGYLSRDRNSLTHATFEPGVETVTRLAPGTQLVEALRVCHRARTGIRISNRPGSGGLGED